MAFTRVAVPFEAGDPPTELKGRRLADVLQVGSPESCGVRFAPPIPRATPSAPGRKYAGVSRSPGPPLGHLAPAPTLWAGTRCRLALTPGRPPQNSGLRAGDGLAGYPSGGGVWRGVSGRPGKPGPGAPLKTSSNLSPPSARTPRRGGGAGRGEGWRGRTPPGPPASQGHRPRRRGDRRMAARGRPRRCRWYRTRHRRGSAAPA